MLVRPATHADAPRLAELATQLGYASSAADVARRLPLLARQDHLVRVAADADGEAQGWIHAVHVLLLDSDPYVEIEALVIDESARGRRLGEALLAAAEEWARAIPCGEMRVRSNVLRERAHRFYERHGYRIFKTQRVFEKRLAPDG